MHCGFCSKHCYTDFWSLVLMGKRLDIQCSYIVEVVLYKAQVISIQKYKLKCLCGDQMVKVKVKKDKVIPLQARCGPEGGQRYSSTLP